MATFLKFEGTFGIDNVDSNTQEVRKNIAEAFETDESTSITVDLDPNTADYAIVFAGGAGKTRKVFIATDTEVTVKLNGSTNTPFQMLSTTVIGGRIDSLYISTSLDPASIQVVAAGL